MIATNCNHFFLQFIVFTDLVSIITYVFINFIGELLLQVIFTNQIVTKKDALH